ncbi:MAG: hypothetical protein K2N49_05905 [Ruminococcus sp.]|nr:hypothetical protein [Ruminococcus sp.]MDE7226377.1 hypothetical protein [Ruminococcus sp.]
MDNNEPENDDKIIDKAIKEDISGLAEQMKKLQRRIAVPVAVFSELRD